MNTKYFPFLYIDRRSCANIFKKTISLGWKKNYICLSLFIIYWYSKFQSARNSEMMFLDLLDCKAKKDQDLINTHRQS